MSERGREDKPRGRRLNHPQKVIVGFIYLAIAVGLIAALAVPAPNAAAKLAHCLIAICALGVLAFAIWFPLMFVMAWREAQAAKRHD